MLTLACTSVCVCLCLTFRPLGGEPFFVEAARSARDDLHTRIMKERAAPNCSARCHDASDGSAHGWTVGFAELDMCGVGSRRISWPHTISITPNAPGALCADHGAVASQSAARGNLPRRHGLCVE